MNTRSSPDLLAREAGRASSWVPDAHLDPHPRLAWLLEHGFDLAVRALYRKHELVAADYALEPGTLVVSNHQRDGDVPIIATTLCRREGLRFRCPLPFCAGREDMLRPGFLRDLLAHWPTPLPSLLGRVPLGWLFRLTRVLPIRRVREFTFGEALSACAAGPQDPEPPERVLNLRGRREVSARLGSAPARIESLIADPVLADLRRANWGLRKLSRRARAAIAPGFRAAIEAQLAQFAHLLDAGRIVYLAPEGANSENGRLRRMRDGAWRICRLAVAAPAVLPVALSYDPIRAGRLRAVVRIGSPLRGLDLSDRRKFDATLRHEILKLCPVTPSHLASRFLVAGPARFTTHDLCDWLDHAARAVADAGLTLDPLLARGARLQALAAGRLAWLARKRLVRRDGPWWRNRWPQGAAPEWQTPAGVVRYLDNALGDLASEFPHLAARLRP